MSAPLSSKAPIKITPNFIHAVLVDKYNSELTNTAIMRKHQITQQKFEKIVKDFGPAYCEKFGIGAKSLKDFTLDDMTNYWDTL